MVPLLHLKYAFSRTDEELCERRRENMVWQLFSGMTNCEPRLPCGAMRIGRIRRVLGVADAEQLLKS